MWSVLLIRHDGTRGRAVQFGTRVKKTFLFKPVVGPSPEQGVRAAQDDEDAAWERDRARWIDPGPTDHEGGPELTELRSPPAGLEDLTLRAAPPRANATGSTWPAASRYSRWWE